MHNAAAQFANPYISLIYDMDQKQALSVRKDVFKKAANKTVLLAGMHLPFPGIGRLRADGENTYTFVPINFLQAQ